MYFSKESTKSLNYSTGYWSGKYDKNCFMFLADVALGKYYIPRSSSDGPFPKKGYDSTYADPQKGTSGLLNSEIIVYDTKRVNLVYLVEFN